MAVKRSAVQRGNDREDYLGAGSADERGQSEEVRSVKGRRTSVGVLIAIGGFAGATSRYLVGAVSGEALISTVIVNALGCFLLGLLLFGTRSSDGLDSRLRFALGTGFAASFTTYSTFVADIVMSDPVIAGLYILVSYGSGFAAIIASRIVLGGTIGIAGGSAP